MAYSQDALHPALERHLLLALAEDNERTRGFLERLADSEYPETLRLTEECCGERFDAGARHTIPLLADASVAEIDEIYGSFLENLKAKLLHWLNELLRKSPPDEKAKVLNRVALHLDARKYKWLAEAKIARASHIARDLHQSKQITEGGRSQDVQLDEIGPNPKTKVGSNIDRLRKECGWSFDQLAKKTGIGKKLILGHVNKGNGMHPETMKTYADAFSKMLGRPVTVAELEGFLPAPEK